MSTAAVNSAKYDALNPPPNAADSIDAAIAGARQAQAEWARRPLAVRLAAIERFRAAVYERRQEVAATIARENGKPVAEAFMTEVATTLDIARFYVRVAPSALAPQHLRSATLALWRKRITVHAEPYGTVAVIAPWNYPFMLPAGIAIPALMAGNAVLLKPSELTPDSALLLADLLQEAGVPDAVMQVIPGDGAVGAALVAGAVDKVFFTGSEATGRRVAHACAERLVPCSLELGGSDAAIVLEDADVEHAASGLAWGRFTNAGQTCVAPKRVFAVGRIHAPLVAALERRLAALQLGTVSTSASFDVGPLIHPSQVATLQAQRDDALARGARLLASDRPAPTPAHVPPALLLDVPPDARVLTEETFGPLLPVVAVRDVDEAVARANDSRYGLSASVWSTNREQARAVAARLEAGTVVLNDVTLIAGVAEVPHGGVKASGTGRSHGLAGLEECVRSRTVVDDLFARWRQPWWFGYGDDAAQRSDAYLRLTHGRSFRERLSGIPDVLRLILRPERPV